MGKPKENYKVAEGELVHGKDLFASPRWITELLIPFIPSTVRVVWECAAGEGRMAKVLREHGFDVLESDVLAQGNPRANIHDFLAGDPSWAFDAVVTNAPFSLKYRFAEVCLALGKPWAILMPFDWSAELARLKRAGCQFVIPDCRVNYITPNILERIWKGETVRAIARAGHLNGLRPWTVKDWDDPRGCRIPQGLIEAHSCANHCAVEDVPIPLLASYTQAQMHSAWVAWGFGLPETLVDIPLLTREEAEEQGLPMERVLTPEQRRRIV